MQTAVQLIFEKLWNTDKDKFTWYSILEQAKEMEKNKLVNFLCWYDNLDQHYNSFTQEDYVNKYYNETYGSKGSDETKTDKI